MLTSLALPAARLFPTSGWPRFRAAMPTECTGLAAFCLTTALQWPASDYGQTLAIGKRP